MAIALFLALLAAAAPAPGTADMRAGTAAWEKGDRATAIARWRTAADAGNADAQYNLGLAYRRGEGVTRSDADAMTLFTRAAGQDHPRAQASLGLMLFQTSRRAEAFPWLEKAAAQGETRAQYVLATALFNGDGLPKDWPRAYALMRRAAGNGLAAAKTSLTQMDTYLSPADRAKAASIRTVAPTRSAKAKAPAEMVTKAAPVLPAPVESASAKGVPVAAPNLPAPSPPKVAKVTKPAPDPSGRWTIQLGAFGDKAGAETHWRKIRGRAAFAGLTPRYVSWEKGVRLRAGPIPDRVTADRLCRDSAADGQPCFPVAP